MFISAAMAATEGAEHAEGFFEDPTVWVALAFILFIALIIYLKLPGKITAQLDTRADRIRNELEEAKRLREEAQSLYAEYQRKAEDALKEADRIVAHAREEAERVGEKARADLEASIERRRQQAEQKIAQAEQQALDEVRAKAVNIAIAAATDILKEDMQGASGSALIDSSIDELGKHLH
ncbi:MULTISPECIES: ATP F0F1 synthase subunit B [unclassified Minwuia]|jgi:F-type H+-transporting ATPase subunit b|uniref:F0F1 ATP synthase subunit B family protein n=1 Tax=unclassified Minwuia TaxID=2618799 RepID=UPI00247AF522|nr:MULTISPECIES: ATP F0F1 synthase subunit B [unclassified Minwuia]